MRTSALPTTYPRTSRAAFAAALLLALAGSGHVLRAATSLSSVSPLGASAGVAVQITGTGFAESPADNDVELIASGVSAHVVPDASVLLDGGTGLRRLVIRVPPGLPVGPASVRVRNTPTGDVADGRTFDIVQLTMTPATGARGATGVALHIAGSSNMTFAAGATRIVVSGVGVSVTSTDVQSPTEATVTVAVAPNAPLGSRTIGITTSTQTALLTDRFTVVDSSTPTVTLTGIDVNPPSIRFAALGTTRPLTVTGIYSNGTTADLTANPGTTYTTTNPFVATVGPDGVTRPVANGDAVFTAHYQQFSDTASAVVELGVSLTTLDLTPPESTLRSVGASVPLTLRGHFSDGDTRDLTTAAGTTYASSNPAIGTVDAAGHVVAVGNGDVTLTAQQDVLSATAIVHVAISDGTGFVRGQVLDDSRSLPLGGATATIVFDGSGPLVTPRAIAVDDRARYALSGAAGAAVVRVTKPGFTFVERTATIASGTAATAFDARLTPLDARSNPIEPALSDVARSQNGDVTLLLAAGSVPTPVALRVTPISAQGLQGRLPFGWSPATAIDLDPPGVAFQQTATLTVPNDARLPSGAPVATARYDTAAHRWIAAAPALVATDARTIVAPVDASGQIVLLLPDDAPFVPPGAVPGQPLAGVAAVSVDASDTASGLVVPRAAPPGDDARAVGAIDLRPSAPRPSGAALQAYVTEHYDLFDASRVTPLAFTQDIALFAKPAAASGAPLSAHIPITPSVAFTINELEHGVVSLDVAPPAADSAAAIVGASGGTATDAAGNSITVAAGALGADTLVDVRSIAPERLAVPVPGGFDRLASLQVDLAGASLAQSATLSIARPAGLADTAQVIVAEAFADPRGIRRLRIVGVGALSASRVALQTGGAFAGLTHGGDYLFLTAPAPLAFVTGSVSSGGAPQERALVTADTAPFADLTRASGAYLVAGAVGATTQVTAAAAATVTSATATLTAAGQVAQLDLALGAVTLTVVRTSPAANAVKVPLNSPIVVEFSEPLDAASATPSSVVLQRGAGSVAGTLALSPDRRIATFLPASELESNASYAVTLAATLRGASGTHLGASAPVAFTTVDASKADVTAGQITADLPDGDGLVLIFGTSGTAEPGSGVTATNLRTQETVTVMASTDGSFRSRLAAIDGDEVSLTLRDARSREVTIAITQFEGPDGTTAIGAAGGTIHGAAGRLGTVRPRALTSPATFRIADLADVTALPLLPAGFSYADRFSLSINGGRFNELRTFTLTESQNRFAAALATSAPFESTGSLVVPSDFLASGSVRFAATAEDAGGNRTTVSGSTLVVASNPKTATIETKVDAAFPIVFLAAPQEAIPSQQIAATAVAPTARVDVDVAPPAGLDAAATVLLARATRVAGERKLAIVDRFASADVDGTPRLQTAGRDLSGAALGGSYGVVVSATPLTFVTGQIAGEARLVALDGSPFVVETSGPNARFRIPVPAGRPFVLNVVDPSTGQIAATATGLAPATGAFTIEQPIGATGAPLTVTAVPDASSLVDLAEPIAFTFSAPIDRRTVGGNVIVTDAAGVQVFGRYDVSADSTRVTFTPNRRWRFAATYRYTVSARVLAIAGGHLSETFSGSFTTFAPAVIGTAAAGSVRDVAASGATVIAGGPSGLVVIDATRPDALAPVAQVTTPNVGAVALLSQAQITDRNGTAIGGSFAVTASGTDAAVGQLQIYDVTSPASPALVGSAQLTVPAGQAAPPNVPSSPGTPAAIALGPDQRAVVAVQSLGVERVTLGAAIPVDAANPGGAIAGRYPAGGLEGANHVALAGDTVLVAGPPGLTLLSAAGLDRLGTIATGGNAQAVAALRSFRMDVNGDGAIDPATEIFDLAVVANGVDGTLQFFDVSDPTAPQLVSVVRVAGSASSVVLDATENLAYIGTGSRGVAFVDLAGPASVQPIDLDRNGVDDRVLATVATRGTAGRIAVDHARGLAYVADGPAGVTAIQVLPPRTQFTSIARDPAESIRGDETSMLEDRRAFLTDSGVRVDVNATIPPQARLFLSIREIPDGEGARLLAFDGGGTSVPLSPGSNALLVRFDHDAASTGAAASLLVQDAAGRTIDRFDFHVTNPDAGGAVVRALAIGPQPAVIDGDRDELQLDVAAVYSNGRILNVTTSGATFEVSNPHVATIDAAGRITAIAGGTSAISVRYGGVAATTSVAVLHRAAVTAIESSHEFVALTGPGAQQSLRIEARLSDGLVDDLTSGLDTTYQSSDAAVVTVDENGRLTAVGEGTATITIANGAFTDHVMVDVHFRTAAVLSAIALDAPPSGLTTDFGSILGRATVQGTGSLDGQEVAFTVSGIAARRITALTDAAGVAVAFLDGPFTAGAGVVSVTVTNPADGATLSASQPVAVGEGSGDHEPNGDPAAASRLETGRTVSGSLAASADPRDVFRLQVDTDGTVTATLVMPQTMGAGDATAAVLSASGSVLRQMPLAPGANDLSQAIEAGPAFLQIDSVRGAESYTLTATFAAAPVTIASVTPIAAPPGTPIAIVGSGFSTIASRNVVLVASIAAKVTSASSTRIDAVVPAGAVNGVLQVMVGRQMATGPSMNVGVQAPLPPIVLTPPDPANRRLDPTTNRVVDVNRLVVRFDALATRAQVDAVAASHGAIVAGYLPTFNTYALEFPAVTSLPALQVVTRAVEADPLVAAVMPSAYTSPRQSSFKIDAADISNWGMYDARSGRTSTQAAAYEKIALFAALRRIRSTPPFDDAANLKSVRVAVVDTGFDGSASEFSDPNSHQSIVQQINAFGSAAAGTLLPTEPFSDPNGHGTKVASVIGAVNDGADMSGIVNGLFDPGNPAERPQPLLVYRIGRNTADGCCYDTAALAALEDINRRNTQGAPEDSVDAANLSFGSITSTLVPSFLTNINEYALRFALLAPRTVVTIAAGNYGVDARYDSPAAAAAGYAHVLVVGATGNANFDGSGEDATGRAIFRGSSRDLPLFFPSSALCDGGVEGGSGCGALVTIAAPGEDVLVDDAGGGLDLAAGTSFSAPMVAGVAALLQAIRPQANPGPLDPSLVAQTLVQTGDPLTGTWTPGTAVRLNADSAVLAFLPPQDQQLVLIADQEADNGLGAGKGKIVGLNVDPMTGAHVGSFDTEMLLDFNRGGLANFFSTQPTSVVYSPVLDELYAVVSAYDGGASDGIDANVGDGVLIMVRRSSGGVGQMQAVDFLPFCGAPFWAGCGGAYPPAVRLLTARPGMVVSKDGRILYVATNNRITVIDLVGRRIVRSLSQLPQPYNLLANRQVPDAMQIRLDSIQILSDNGYVDENSQLRPGKMLSSLALSPDGKTLYAALETFDISSGQASASMLGRQPGAVIPIDVDLYRDAQPTQPGLQADLSTYFTVRNPLFLHMRNPGGPLGGDEPRALAVSPDGQHLYLVNGGVNEFRSVTPDKLNISQYINLWGAASAALSLSGLIGGMTGLLVGVGSQAVVLFGILSRLSSDLQQMMDSGLTLLSANSTVGVFTTAPQQPQATPTDTQEFVFPSDLVFGWHVSTESGNLVVNQFRARNVYTARPYGLAIRPDGKRGLMPFYQTGNFGVLDLDAQKKFLQSPPSVPTANTALFGPPTPDTLFQGVVAATPALQFDNHIWPSRGRVRLFNPVRTDLLFDLPSADEPLLYPWDIQYAQNGRFAVATHSGAGRVPGSVTHPQVVGSCSSTPNDNCGVLPNPFEQEDPLMRQKLADLGLKPDVDVFPGNSIAVPSGGGAVTFIDDKAITDDFATHLNTNETSSGFDPGMGGIERAYYSVVPVCKSVQKDATTGRPIPYCDQPVTTTMLSYNTSQSPQRRFHRPRGVTIQPFVTIEEPRFGDVVDPTTAVVASWRDSRVTAYQLHVLDLDHLDANGDPTIVGGDAGFFSGQETQSHRKRWTFGPLNAGTPLVNRHHYRLELEIIDGTSGDRLSRTYSDVSFSSPSAATLCSAPPPTLMPNKLQLFFKKTPAYGEFTYRVPLAPGDSLAGPLDFHIVRDPNDPPLAVEIATVPPRSVGNDFTGYYRLTILDETQTPDPNDVFARDDFRVELSYSTTNCGATVISTQADVEIVGNNIAAQGDVVSTPPTRQSFDVCSFTIAKFDMFRSALSPAIVEDLHFDPLECEQFVRTPLFANQEYRERTCEPTAAFPSDLKLNIDLGGGQHVLVHPLYSVTNLVLTSEVPKEEMNDGVGNDDGICETGEVCEQRADGSFVENKAAEKYERGVRPSVTPIFDTKTGTVTNQQALAAQGFWVRFEKSIHSDRTTSAGSACPDVRDADQSVADFLYGTDMLVQCLPNQSTCPTNKYLIQR